MPRLLVVAVTALLLFGAVANGEGLPAWLRNGEIHRDDEVLERRLLSAEFKPESAAREKDTLLVAPTYRFLENNEVVSESMDSCYASPLINGVRVFCNGKMVTGVVSTNPDGSGATFFERVSDNEVVSYDKDSQLVQPEIAKRNGCSANSHDHDHDHHHHDEVYEVKDILDEPHAEEGRKLRSSHGHSPARDLQVAGALYGDQTLLKFLDVFVAVDFRTYKAWGGNRASVEARVLSIIALTKQIYIGFRPLPYGVNVRLAGIQVFTSNDPFNNQETRSTELLAAFNTWRSRNVNAAHTVAHLFTANSLDDVVGAYARPVACQSESKSTLSYSLSPSNGYLAKLLAHALGHSIGLQHTSQYSPGWGVDYDMALKCYGEANDVMRSTLPVDNAEFSWGICGPAWFRSFVSGFPHDCDFELIPGAPTRCTLSRPYGRRSDYPMCMESNDNRKVRDELSTCGDGVVDSGEQCDCGPSMDEATCRVSFCCEKSTCRRIPGCVASRAPSKSPVRVKPTVRPTPNPTHVESFNCYHTCWFNADGFCQDGGPGSVSGACPYGSDCIDCGVREDYTRAPTFFRSSAPTPPTTLAPTNEPTKQPTRSPTNRPTQRPSKSPTDAPTRRPTNEPTFQPTKKPTNVPTDRPTKSPTFTPTQRPTADPTVAPSKGPTPQPTYAPTKSPTDAPTRATKRPTSSPTTDETNSPTTGEPTMSPSSAPSASPTTSTPSVAPSSGPTTSQPSVSPTSSAPTTSPTELACPSDDALNKCRVGKDPCNKQKNCNFCSVNKQQKRCFASLPADVAAATGMTACSPQHQSFIQSCLSVMKNSAAPTVPDDEEDDYGTSQAPTPFDPSAVRQCPLSKQVDKCSKFGRTKCIEKSQCAWCNQHNPSKPAKCYLLVDGLDKCSNEHQDFIDLCIKSVTLEPTASPTAFDPAICPDVESVNLCRVGRAQCLSGGRPCAFCNNKCLPVLPGMDAAVCSADHVASAAECMKILK